MIDSVVFGQILPTRGLVFVFLVYLAFLKGIGCFGANQ